MNGTDRPQHLNRFGRIRLGVFVCAALVGFAGCQGQRPSFTRNGSLKAGLSQIQFENDTLKAQIAKLEKQNRQLLADLEREESHNGTLAARLDESRNLLRNQGVNVPLEIDQPRIVARSEAARDTPRTTYGEIRPTPRRSRYATGETPVADSDSIPENETGTEKREPTAKPKGHRPPAFPDDPPAIERFGEEVPELSSNDLSTGWRRLSYRDLRETPSPSPRR